MYCFIRYSEKPLTDYSIWAEEDNWMLQSRNSLGLGKSGFSLKRLPSARPSNTSITSLSNKTVVVNPDCYIQILMDYIMTEANYTGHHPVDLADENGVILDVNKLKPYESAKTLLNHKQTYYAIVYEKDEDNVYTHLEPFIYKLTKQDSEFYLKVSKNLRNSIAVPEKSFTKRKSHNKRRSSSRISKKSNISNTDL